LILRDLRIKDVVTPASEVNPYVIELEDVSESKNKRKQCQQLTLQKIFNKVRKNIDSNQAKIKLTLT
jgi:hypothetical protein